MQNYTTRFLLNTDANNKEVHDLQNEKPLCQIGEIEAAKPLEGVTTVDELEAWLNDNSEYDGCAHCLPDLHRK